MLDANTRRKKLYLVSVSHWYDLFVFGMTLLRHGYEFGIQFLICFRGKYHYQYKCLYQLNMLVLVSVSTLREKISIDANLQANISSIGMNLELGIGINFGYFYLVSI